MMPLQTSHHPNWTTLLTFDDLSFSSTQLPTNVFSDVVFLFFFFFWGLSTTLQTQLGAVGLELNYQPSSSKLGLAGCRKHVCFRWKKLLPPSLSCWGSFEGPPNYCFYPKTKGGNCSVAKVPPCSDKTHQ